MYKVLKEIRPEEVEMKKTFADTMEEMAAKDDAVVYFDCDVINSIGMVGFGEKYPDRCIDCGIQEANMIGVAAGRVIDQVYISAAYAKLNVRMIGSDAGVTASYNGGTHMPIEDMGLMRTIPEVTLLEPTDSVMLADLMRQTKDMYGVFYIRITRKVVDKVFEDGSTFEIGKAVELRDGSDVTLITSGYCTTDTIKAAEILAKEGISAKVLNMFTWKPLDVEAIVAAAQKTGAIVTVENHNVINGLGSAVAEVVGEHCPVPMKRIGVQDRFGEVGSIDYLKGIFGMTVEDIVAAAKETIKRK